MGITLQNMFIDFETYSEVDIKKVGAWAYSLHPSTEVLCMAYLPDRKRATPKILTATAFHSGCPFPTYEYRLNAFNAAFEYAIWHNQMVLKYGWPHVPLTQWACTAAKAAAVGLPASLKLVALALDLPQQKGSQSAMLKLCKPHKPTKTFPYDRFTPANAPSYFGELYDYCMQDVVVEKAVHEATPPLHCTELDIWQLDQTINLRGIPIDLSACDAALEIDASIKKDLNAELFALTGIESGTKRDQILKWCNAHGAELLDLKAATVLQALQDPPNEKVKRVLEIRKEVARTSVAKYAAMRQRAVGGRVHGAHIYHRAHTGRWAGAGVQFQNVARGFDDLVDMEQAIEAIKTRDLALVDMLFDDTINKVLSKAIRGVIHTDKKLLVGDFSSIEAMVLAWLSNEAILLENFRKNIDPYVQLAMKIYNVPEEEVTKSQRFVGKTAVLGLGFGMGPKRFFNQCADMGVTITEDLAVHVYDLFRNGHKQITRWWYDLYNAACKAVESGHPMSVGRVICETEGRWLRITLPSGRKISYTDPHVKIVRPKIRCKIKTHDPEPPKDTKIYMRKGLGFAEWDGDTEKTRYVDVEVERSELSFVGVESPSGKWKRISTYPGKMTENIVQAVARDFLAAAMLRLEQKEYPVIMHVHDEIVVESDGGLNTMLTIMEQVPEWGHGCPIKASGYESTRYRKD